MSIRVMADIWEHSKLTGTPLLLVLALADYANDERRCWPSTKTLGAKARISQRHTQRLLRRLVEAGHISIHQSAGPHGCNLYGLPTAAEMSALTDLESARKWEEAGGDTCVIPDTSDGGMTLVACGDDTSGAQGMTLVSSEPSLNHQEPSVPDVAQTARPPPGGGGESWAWINLLCEVCRLDIELSKGKAGNFAKRFRKAGYTLDEVRDYYGAGGWWYKHDFRGKKGQPPTLAVIYDTIRQAREFRPGDGSPSAEFTTPKMAAWG